MRTGLASLVVFLVALPAFASVGHVTALEGHATRTPANGEAQPLAVGTPIEAHDTLDVQDGQLEVTLDDNSVLALDAGSELEITQAVFKDGERSFLGSLRLGSLWTSVRKAVEGEKSRFVVQTEQAIAGVRGTVFRVDVASAMGDPGDTLVSVEEGKVAVSPVASASPGAGAGNVAPKAAPAPRLLVANTALRVQRGRMILARFLAAKGRFAAFLARRRANALKLRATPPRWWLNRSEHRQQLRQRLKLRRRHRLLR